MSQREQSTNAHRLGALTEPTESKEVANPSSRRKYEFIRKRQIDSGVPKASAKNQHAFLEGSRDGYSLHIIGRIPYDNNRTESYIDYIGHFV